ncbi:DUF3303 family protein [Bradyrhizobium jicamae]|uniref:DUF3303 family protein n=1 Tax=Bradyrhizobium jicamae TaxID=280332 RepID=A0ABS5FXW6_9BRAD|nr:DUF3303 family protein [Bradyrhizobium jicamae]MBR0801681.1 DUF3303 family protein [Bradyrhizobium jicamae]
MKYKLEYTVRTAGLSHDQNLAGSQSLLTAFSRWKADEEKGLTIHAFVANLSGRGGYVLVEANDPKIITTFVSKYYFWNDISVVPVIDIGESVPIIANSLAWAQSAALFGFCRMLDFAKWAQLACGFAFVPGRRSIKFRGSVA